MGSLCGERTRLRTSSLILSLRPVPIERLKAMDALGGNPVGVSLADVEPAKRTRFMVDLVWGRRDFIVVECEPDDPFAGLLLGLAAVGRARKRWRLDHAGLHALGRMAALGVLAQLLAASMSGMVAMAFCARQLKTLARNSTMAATPGDGPVFYINPTLWRGPKVGGAVAHTVGVIRGLTECGYKVEALSAVGEGLVPRAVTLHPLCGAPLAGLPTEANLYRHHRRVTRQALKLCRGHRHAFVYQRLTLGSYPGVTVSRALGVPLVLEYNGSEVWIARNWGKPLRFESLALAAESACLRHAAVVVTVSEPLRDELIAKGVEPSRIVVQPNGVDPDPFDPDRMTAARRQGVRNSLGVPDGAFVIGFLGTFGRWHGADILAKAIRLLADEHHDWVVSRKLHAVFIGDGVFRPATEACLPDGTPYAAFRTFTGLIDQARTPECVLACDGLVSPHVANADGSPFFGSPTKLFEYMASGRPIIASRLDQIAEVLSGSPRADDPGPLPPDACALLVDPGDVSGLAHAIKRLADSPSEHAALGVAARRRVLERHTWHGHVRAILDHLDKRFPQPSQ